MPENDRYRVMDNGFGYTIENKQEQTRLRRTLSHDPDDAWLQWCVLEMHDEGSSFADIGTALDITADEAGSIYQRVSTYGSDTVGVDAP